MKFMYLQKILKRNDEHWTQKMLLHLASLNTGWARNIQQKLKDYKLEEDWTKIEKCSKPIWKRSVKAAVAAMNKQKLIESCIERQGNTERVKTKSKYIMDQINQDSYQHQPIPELIASSKLQTKTLIIARAGMLECGKNLKGTIPETCKRCHVLDDENHRMKECPDWHLSIEPEDLTQVDFQDIYCNDPQKLQTLMKHIQSV